MKVTITQVKPSLKGGDIRKSRQLTCGKLSIGRGTDQSLHTPDMRAALQHAELEPLASGDFQLHALSAAGVLVNGKRQQHQRVSVGDVLRVGNTEIRLVSPAADEDLQLEVRELAAAEQKSRDLPDRAVLEGLMGRRRLSWLLFILVLGCGLVLPLVGFYDSGLQHILRESKLPSDAWWQAGELNSAHHYFGNDCQSCHVEAFKPAPDGVCQDCHADAWPHASFEDSTQPALAANQCESCHREHNGDEGFIPAGQGLCADCHGGPLNQPGMDEILLAVRDFGLDHPEFRARLLRFDEQGQVSTQRVSLDDEELAEQSSLTFPHDVHLAAEGLEAPDGTQVLQCASCHSPDASGQLMQPISFDAHCGSCHQLNFDPSNPDRVVPHGKPGEVINVLTEFYSELGLRGAGGEVGIEPLRSNEPAQVLLWARRQAARTGEALFEGRACGECHQVSKASEDNQVVWRVQPARLAGIWFPKARFDHGSHTAMTCQDCHAAATSDSASDVLLPGIAECQTCHGGEHSEELLASSCVSCHSFHNPPRQPLTLNGSLAEGRLYLWDRPDIEAVSRQLQRGDETRRRRPGTGE